MSYVGSHLVVFEKSKIQAVYMNDGSIYLGHIQSVSGSGIVLSNVYNLKLDASGQDQQGQSESLRLQSGSAKNVVLIKWGFYQPLQSDGSLHVSNSSILFWETLNPSSEVVKQIHSAAQ